MFNPKILLPIHFSLSARLALPAHLAFGPASPVGLPSPTGQSLPCRPIWPVCRWRLHRNTFSFLVRTFQAGRVLSHLSLSSGPWLSALCPTPRQLTPAAPPLNPTAPGHPAPPSSTPRMAASHLNSPRHQDPLFNPHLTSPSSKALKTLTPLLPHRQPLPGVPPAPIKGEHHPRTSPHLVPSLSSPFGPSFTLATSSSHRRRPAATLPPAPR
jgi:hypothetical protein